MAKRTADSSIVALRLKTLRRERGIKTQADLAKAANIPLISIKRYESGETVPEPPNLLKLSRFYRVQAEWILGFSDHKSVWEEYEREHTQEISTLKNEIKLLEYCEQLGCNLNQFDSDELTSFKKEIDEFIIFKYNKLKGRDINGKT